MATLTVTAKGQITLKQELLRHLNVSPGEKIQAEKLPDGRILVQAAPPTGTIAAFSGFLHKPGREPLTPLTIDEINEATADAWAGKR